MIAKAAKILTIEDARAVRETIVAYLEDSGFTVIEAENGRIGIEKCRQEHPDLVLCDLRMPEMDGLDVLAVVTEEFPETPIIVVSGMGGLGDAIKALKLGAWDYVTKPIEDMAVLEHAINKALERGRLLRENREYREHLEAVNKQLQQSLKQLEEDEEAGRLIQFQLLPEGKKGYGDYEFSHHLLTSMYLSGDFVDYFVIDADHLGFYMADVSGHGVSSAFVTVLLKSYMNRYLEIYRQDTDGMILDPSKVLKRLNQDIFRGHLGKYLTMFYGVINKSDNRLYYSNGGQFPFPILFDGTRSIHVGHKSLPIGLFDFAEYQTEAMDLPPLFMMAMISDGILETLPQSNMQEKQTFLLSLLKDIEETVESLTRQLGLDETDTLPDDVTLLLIKKKT